MPAETPAKAPAGLQERLVASFHRLTRRHAATVSLFKSSAAEAQKSRLPQMAAALAYRTVFGLIPVFVVSLVAVRVFFASNDKLAEVVTTLLDKSGLSAISVQEQQMGPPMPVDAATAAGGAGNAHLDQWIKELVEKVSGINFAAVGWVSLAALLYAAISMLVEVERAFNQIYRVPVGRSWARRITQYWTLMTLGTLGLVGTFVMGEKFTTWLNVTVTWGGRSNALFLALAGYITTVSISAALFLLAYTVVPNTRVKLGPALAGAVLSACLWEAGKWGLSQYIRSSSSGYARLYGSLALVPLFLLWVYVTWCIVLFGLNFAYYLQHGRYHTKAQPSEMLGPVIIDPASTLALMAAMARRFDSGKPAEPKGLADEIAIQEPVVRQMLERLAAAGLILPLKTDDQAEARYALARPPSRIDATEILKVGEDLSGGVRPDAVSQAMQEARLQRVNGRTLAAFMAGESPAASNSEPRPPSRPARPPVPVET